jgi:hypothetical protein
MALASIRHQSDLTIKKHATDNFHPKVRLQDKGVVQIYAVTRTRRWRHRTACYALYIVRHVMSKLPQESIYPAFALPAGPWKPSAARTSCISKPPPCCSVVNGAVRLPLRGPNL